MKEIIIKTISEYVEYIEGLPESPKLWFRGVANEDYYPVPGTVWKNVPIHKEGLLEHQFLVSYQNYIDNKNLTDWDLFALMQHHGLPTRLLDWSESSLVALYFALTTEPESNAKRAVWVINPFELNQNTIGTYTLYCPSVITNSDVGDAGKKIDINRYLPPNLKPKDTDAIPEKPIAIIASQNVKRVSAQKGCFTLNGSLNESIDTYITNPDYCQRITLELNSEAHRTSMIKVLAALGIDEESIYQDLNSLCNKIKREFNVQL